jgi:hypothetical protein
MAAPVQVNGGVVEFRRRQEFGRQYGVLNRSHVGLLLIGLEIRC